MTPWHVVDGARALLALAFALLGYAAARVAPLPRAQLGRRGLQRAQALQRYVAFRAVELLLRYLGAWCTRLCPAGLLHAIATWLAALGDPLGLAAEELIAASLLTAAISARAAQLATHLLGAPPWLLHAAIGFGLVWPSLRIVQAHRERVKRITRGLPDAIDLLSLCMSAGLDFVGTLRLLEHEPGLAGSALGAELSHLVKTLELGHTRAQALTAFAERVTSPAVRDFCSAVVQAEDKGTPLVQVLEVQARMSRMQRSVRAEEAAARAAVMLVLPMMLLLAAIMTVMFGPFLLGATF